MIHQYRPDGFVSDFCAVGCFVESGGQILQLLRAKDRKIEPGKWGCPAGRVEEGEAPENAMQRELREETELRVSLRQLELVGRVFVSYPSFRFEYPMFRLRFPYKPEIVLSAEHTAYTWIAPAEACSLDLMRDEWEVIKLAYRF